MCQGSDTRCDRQRPIRPTPEWGWGFTSSVRRWQAPRSRLLTAEEAFVMEILWVKFNPGNNLQPGPPCFPGHPCSAQEATGCRGRLKRAEVSLHRQIGWGLVQRPACRVTGSSTRLLIHRDPTFSWQLHGAAERPPADIRSCMQK